MSEIVSFPSNTPWRRSFFGNLKACFTRSTKTDYFLKSLSWWTICLSGFISLDLSPITVESFQHCFVVTLEISEFIKWQRPTKCTIRFGQCVVRCDSLDCVCAKSTKAVSLKGGSLCNEIQI